MEDVPKMPKSDHDLLVKTFSEGLLYSVTKFDTISLTISSGALVLTLSFIKDIIPLKDSVGRWQLYASIWFFAAGILGAYVGHLLSMHYYTKYLNFTVEHQYHKLEKNALVHYWNCATAFAIVLGMVMLVLFCVQNLKQ